MEGEVNRNLNETGSKTIELATRVLTPDAVRLIYPASSHPIGRLAPVDTHFQAA